MLITICGRVGAMQSDQRFGEFVLRGKLLNIMALVNRRTLNPAESVKLCMYGGVGAGAHRQGSTGVGMNAEALHGSVSAKAGGLV